MDRFIDSGAVRPQERDCCPICLRPRSGEMSIWPYYPITSHHGCVNQLKLCETRFDDIVSILDRHSEINTSTNSELAKAGAQELQRICSPRTIKQYIDCEGREALRRVINEQIIPIVLRHFQNLFPDRSQELAEATMIYQSRGPQFYQQLEDEREPIVRFLDIVDRANEDLPERFPFTDAEINEIFSHKMVDPWANDLIPCLLRSMVTLAVKLVKQKGVCSKEIFQILILELSRGPFRGGIQTSVKLLFLKLWPPFLDQN